MPYVFLIILASILAADLLWWRHADRRARRLRHALGWRLLVGLFMGTQVTLLLWMLGGRALAGQSLGPPPRVLSAAAYLWHLLILPIVCVLALKAGVLVRLWRSGRRLVMVAARDPSSADAPTHGESTAVPVSRRQLLGMMTATAPVLLTGGSVAYSLGQLERFRIRSMDLPLAGLPPGLDGLRIALVSDLHVGTFTSGPVLKRIVEETSRLDADLVLLPGDLINNALADLSDALDAVANMQSRHGSYLCVGNHDLIEDGAVFVRRVRDRLPHRLLVDETRVLSIRGHDVQLLGLPWEHDEQSMASSVRRLAVRLTPGAFPILLAHHPHAFDAAAAAGIPLTLSGHTHGGQLMLGSLGFGPLMYRYWSGLYRKPEQSGAALVVSNGVGNWFPLRVGAPAEIIHLTLRSPG